MRNFESLGETSDLKTAEERRKRSFWFLSIPLTLQKYTQSQKLIGLRQLYDKLNLNMMKKNVSTRVTTSDKSAVAVHEAYSRVGGCVAAPHFANHIPNLDSEQWTIYRLYPRAFGTKMDKYIMGCNEVSQQRRPSGIADPRLSGISGSCF